MVDWTELERLYEAFACTYHPITEDNPEYDRLCGALARSFPAILAERREMLAKLEAAAELIALANVCIRYVERIPKAEVEWLCDSKPMFENWLKQTGYTVGLNFSYPANKALAAFDKEQTE